MLSLQIRYVAHFSTVGLLKWVDYVSIADQVAIENMQKAVKELKERPDYAKTIEELSKRVETLEDKYKMLNARVGWKKE